MTAKRKLNRKETQMLGNRCGKTCTSAKYLRQLIFPQMSTRIEEIAEAIEDYYPGDHTAFTIEVVPDDTGEIAIKIKISEESGFESVDTYKSLFLEEK